MYDGVALDGVMVGRAAYHTPLDDGRLGWSCCLAKGAKSDLIDPRSVEAAMVAYTEAEMIRQGLGARGGSLASGHAPCAGSGQRFAWCASLARQVWSDHKLKEHLPSEVMRLARMNGRQ